MRKKLILFIASLVLAFVAVKANKIDDTINNYNEKEDNGLYYKQFMNVFEIVEAAYVDKADKKKLVESALNGMLSSLDPYSAYLSDDEYRDFKNDTKGEFCGIGVEIVYDNNAIKVISPIDDLPAYKAGIKAGDYILAVDGENVSNIGYFTAVNKMRGEKGTKVVLTVLTEKDKQTKEIEIIRDVVKINPVKYHLDEDVAYIKITTFNEMTTEDLKKAMNTLSSDKDVKINGIILDLRNNPGGLLDQGIAVAEYFLDSGVIVTVKGKNESDLQVYSAKRFIPKAPKVPMVTLVNYGSASASEIVAGALQDNKRSIILGTKTFGKGLVQSVMPLSKDAAVKLTTAKFYTPSGKVIHEKGVEPDITIKPLIVQEDIEASQYENNFRKYLRQSKTKSSVENNSEMTKTEDKNNNQVKNKFSVPEKYNSDYQYGIAKKIVTALAITNN